MPDIPGSKPRKLIKKTTDSNPSLLSNSVSCLFNPELMASKGLHINSLGQLKPYSTMIRSSSLNNIRFGNVVDRRNSQALSSYKTTQDDFRNFKIGSSADRKQLKLAQSKGSDQFKNNIDSLNKAHDDFVNKKLTAFYPARQTLKTYQEKQKCTEYRSSMGLSNLSQLDSYKNTGQGGAIKTKQMRGYDIINCMLSNSPQQPAS